MLVGNRGFTVYRCRYCAEEFEGDPVETMATLAAYNGDEEGSRATKLATLLCTHACSSGHMGIADLIGLRCPPDEVAE